jgi:ABC-type transport system involved in multi-copper enzyme maturation permease subunit
MKPVPKIRMKRGKNMFKKEFRDIFKPTLVRLSVLLIVPLFALFNVPIRKISLFLFASVFRFIKGPAYHVDIYMISFIFLFGIMIIFIANYYGTKAFRGEHKDRAFEYLLSFPFSKGRILLYKLVPRFVVVAVLTAVYEFVAFRYLVPLEDIRGGMFFLVDPVFFPFWVLFFFMAGFFLGLFEQKNWVAVVTLNVFLAAIFISIGLCSSVLRAIEPEILLRSYFTGLSFLMGIFVILIVLGAAFFLVYRKFDMKSPGLYARRYSFFVLPPLVAFTVLSIYLLISW